MGFEESKKPGLASFWRPAKQKVKPRNNRKGIRTQPAEYRKRGGGPSSAQFDFSVERLTPADGGLPAAARGPWTGGRRRLAPRPDIAFPASNVGIPLRRYSPSG